VSKEKKSSELIGMAFALVSVGVYLTTVYIASTFPTWENQPLFQLIFILLAGLSFIGVGANGLVAYKKKQWKQKIIFSILSLLCLAVTGYIVFVAVMVTALSNF
jgi:hypothetical protein